MIERTSVSLVMHTVTIVIQPWLCGVQARLIKPQPTEHHK
jgi:hypothetical protein